MSEQFVLGIDIGGTKVAAGLVNAAGEIVSKVRVPMDASGTAARALDCVFLAIDKALQAAAPGSVTAIGVSSPGPLDPHTGIVLHTPNLPCWIDFPLRREIEQKYGLPVRLDNDANAAGLAHNVIVSHASTCATTLRRLRKCVISVMVSHYPWKVRLITSIC